MYCGVPSWMGHGSESDPQNPHRYHRLHRYPSVFTVLPRAVLEKILQILFVWLGSSVPHRKSWKCLPAVFPSIHSYTLWRLFLEVFQQVCTYGFLFNGINNSIIRVESSYHLRWFWEIYIIKKSDSAVFAKLICLGILVMFVRVLWITYPQVLISRMYLMGV